MKTKWRFIFLGTLVFILFVSYKILEPELYKNNRAAEEDGPAEDETQVVRVYNLKPDVIIQNGVNIAVPVKIDQVVRSMSYRFTPLYDDFQLHNQSPWKVAADWVSARQIHPENPRELGAVLRALSRANVTSADVGHKGTQLKLTLVLDGKQRVVFKPAWYSRDFVITGTPYEGKDRHNGEIAAFHLGRILELRRTPLAVGRKLDINRDILSVATPTLTKTFFEQDGELCFYGKCHYCKGPEDGVCAQAGKLEGTVVLWVSEKLKMVSHRHPWSRTYRIGVEPKWSKRSDWCELVKKHNDYRDTPLVLDIIDTAIFDFLIGNADRHMFETFEGLPDSMLIMLDNGKSFGNPDHDEMTILAPLYQCCLVRSHIWQRLLSLQDGVLSRVLSNVLSYDPVAPVLSQRHLQAMDRRLGLVIEQIETCIARVGIDVIVVDNLADS